MSPRFQSNFLPRHSKIHQNPDSHSGTSDPNTTFFERPFNMRHTIHVLSVALTHITNFINSFDPPLPNFVGIELLNEPAPGRHTPELKQWYSDAIRSLRTIDSGVPIVIGDSWQTDDFAGYLSQKADSLQHPHIVLDHHLYRCFTKEDIDVLAYDHAGRIWDLNGATRQSFSNVTDKLTSVGCDMMVGEWSGALNPKSLDPLPNKDHARSQFIQAQVDLYEQYCAGNFFWTYKKQWEGDKGWSFRDAVRGGVFPKSIGLRLKRPLDHHSREARLNSREIARSRSLGTPQFPFVLSPSSCQTYHVIGRFKANMRPIGPGTLEATSTGGLTKGSFKDGTTPMRSSLLQVDLCFRSWDTKGLGQKSGNVRTSQKGGMDHVSGNTVRGSDLYPRAFNIDSIETCNSFVPEHGFIQGLSAARLDIAAACC